MGLSNIRLERRTTLDDSEFRSRAKALIAALMPRISPDGVELLDLTACGGEYSYTVKDRAGLIAHDRVGITGEELVRLRRLLEYLGREVRPEVLDLVEVEPGPFGRGRGEADGMTIVARWTGAHALCLRNAMRLSQREFAHWLGVGSRTVGEWESRGSAYVQRKALQEALDAALTRVPTDVRHRFQELLAEQLNGSVIPQPGETGAEVKRAAGLALSWDSEYVVPADVIHAVGDFVTGSDSVLMVTGEAGAGKSRLAAYLQASLTDVADLQWHSASALAWSGTVEQATLGILRLMSADVNPGADPMRMLAQTVYRLKRPLVVVIDGAAGPGGVIQLANVIDTLLLQGLSMLKFVVMVRTPPMPQLSAWPILAATTTVVDLPAWSLSTARHVWQASSADVEFDVLPVAVQHLSRNPLLHQLLTADPYLPNASTFDVISRAVAAIVGGRIHNGYLRLAFRQLRDVIPPSLQPPPEDGGEVPESAIVCQTDNGQLAYRHDVIAEHIAAVAIADQISQWGRTTRAVELVNELAKRAALSASARGLFDQVVHALDRRGMLVGIAQSPLADADTTLPIILDSTSPNEIVAACARRCRTSTSIELLRALLKAPNLTHAVGPEWTQWWCKAIETGPQIWDEATLAAEHTLTATEATTWLDTIDADAALPVATWTAGALAVLTGDPHPVTDMLVAHPSWQVRAAVTRSLACGQTAGWAEETVDTLVADHDYKVRAAAASTLVGPLLQKHLRTLLCDDSWYVRARCLESVLANGEPEIMKDAVAAVTSDAAWWQCPADSRAMAERLLVLHDPEKYATELPVTTWRLLREDNADQRLPTATVRVLRDAAIAAPTWIQRREAEPHMNVDAIGPVQAPAPASAWRRLRGQRHIQVAIDQPDLARATAVAQASVKAGCLLIEVGDPLIKAHGTAAITRVKESVPEATVVAEMMSADWGRDQVETAAAAGADAVLLIGPASPASVAAAAQAARRYGVPIILDVPASASSTWIRDVETAGADGLAVTTNIDLGSATGDAFARARWLRSLTRLPVSVSGGFSAESTIAPDWDVLIVGRAVAEAVDPGRAADEFIRISQQDWEGRHHD